MITCSNTPLTYADDTTGNCLIVCSPNYYGNSKLRICVSACPSEMYADPLTRMCVSKCSPELGYFGDSSLLTYNKSMCVSTCPATTFAEPFTQTCATTCKVNPKMYGFDNGNTFNPVRTCVYSCPYPYVTDNSTSLCKIVCNNANYPYIDQAAQ